MEKKLLVISNHPPDKWGEEQKQGWDKIEFVPFPNVSPYAGEEINKVAEEICNLIANSPCEHVCLQGEFSVVAKVFSHYGYLRAKAEFDIINSAEDKFVKKCFVFPTTERVVEEKTNPDGRVEKLYHFRFVRWREI